MFHKRLEIREHSGPVYALAYDQQFLYSASADKYVTRWDGLSGTQDKFAIRFDHAVYALKIVENFLFAGCNNGDLYVFDLTERKELKHFQQHRSAIFSIGWSHKTGLIYVGDADGNLSIWNPNSLKLLSFLPLACGKIRHIHLSSESILLATASGNCIVLDLMTLNETHRIYAHKDACTTVLSTDSGIFTGGKDAYLRAWDFDGNKTKAIPAHSFAIYRLLDIGNELISCSRDKSIKIWTKNLEPVQRLDVKLGGHSHSVNDLILLSETQFASCSDDRRVIVWERGN